MAIAQVTVNFPEQLKQTRKRITDSFLRLHEALRLRENALVYQVNEIEREYYIKTRKISKLAGTLNKTKSSSTSDILTDIANLTAETDNTIEFEWDRLYKTDIEQLGSIRYNDQTNNTPSRTFSPQVKPVVPDYKAKHLPTAYCCKKSSQQKAPGEVNNARCIAVHYKTGHIYIADATNNRVQIFTNNGDYLFMFDEKMNYPLGICITQKRVLVTQHTSHCVNMYKLEGKLIKSVGSKGIGETQFNCPFGLAVSDRTNNVYVTESNRVQILTEDLKFHSMFGTGMFKNPYDIKVTRDRVLVLDQSDPCMFVFDSNHVLTNRLITHSAGKQTYYPVSFDIDREYNIIVSDYSGDCVCVFNQEGGEIHRIGKRGQGIGEFINPWGVTLDNTGRIVVVCQKDTACLQFF